MVKDKYIELLNFNWNKSIIEHPDYNNLLDKIHKYYKIDKDIISVLLELHLFQNISNINFKNIDGNLLYIIPENPKLNLNYRNSPSYIFATYSIYNKEFKIKNKKRNYLLLSEEEKLKIVIELDLVSFDSDIYCNIEFNENYLIPYDINLLTSTEKNELKQSINYQEGKLSEQLTDYAIDNSLYFRFQLAIYDNPTLIGMHNEIKIQTEECYDYYISLLNEFKEYNKKFFERALLELELKNF